MTDRWQAYLALERGQDLLRESMQEQEVNRLLGTGPRLPVYGPLLDKIGSYLIETGLNLRSRYGRLELHVDGLQVKG